jgi:hypothetical protein
MGQLLDEKPKRFGIHFSSKRATHSERFRIAGETRLNA